MTQSPNEEEARTAAMMFCSALRKDVALTAVIEASIGMPEQRTAPPRGEPRERARARPEPRRPQPSQVDDDEPRFISIKFANRCLGCRAQINVGDYAWWKPRRGCMCTRCKPAP